MGKREIDVGEWEDAGKACASERSAGQGMGGRRLDRNTSAAVYGSGC